MDSLLSRRRVYNIGENLPKVKGQKGKSGENTQKDK